MAIPPDDEHDKKVGLPAVRGSTLSAIGRAAILKDLMRVDIPAPKRRAIRNSLELKLRRAKGTRLQEFLAAMMTKVYGDNFVPVGTDYSRGDLQCDGMLLDPLTIYACYGPVNAGANATEGAMATAVKKVATDFAGALKEWPAMKAWRFVHNYVEIPAQIVQAVLALDAQHPGIDIALFGKEQFESTVMGLDQVDIEELIGDAATEEDFRSLHPMEVFAIVEHIVASGVHHGVPDDEPVEVPEEKLYFNGLGWLSKRRIIDGMTNAATVADILLNHQNPLLDAELASVFKAKYLDLKAQALDPDELMFVLYDFAGGGAKTGPAREVAVWSLLAHLFEKCTIFEDAPVMVTV